MNLRIATGLRLLAATLLATLIGHAPAGQAPRENYVEPNKPTVWSGENGIVYVRSVPAKTTGIDGKTSLFLVKPEGDQLIDEYPYYMPGELHVAWCRSGNKWCIVHLEPYEVRSDVDPNMFKVARLVFYMGGKQIVSYTFRDLEGMGLDKRLSIENRLPNSFEVIGIRDTGDAPRVFMIKRVLPDRQIVDVPFELATGKLHERSTKVP